MPMMGGFWGGGGGGQSNNHGNGHVLGGGGVTAKQVAEIVLVSGIYDVLHFVGENIYCVVQYHLCQVCLQHCKNAKCLWIWGKNLQCSCELYLSISET